MHIVSPQCESRAGGVRIDGELNQVMLHPDSGPSLVVTEPLTGCTVLSETLESGSIRQTHFKPPPSESVSQLSSRVPVLLVTVIVTTQYHYCWKATTRVFLLWLPC